MTDFTTVMWKEIAELLGNRRFLWVFSIAALAMGILPALTFANHHGHSAIGNSQDLIMVRVLYVLFATAIVVAQTAPDMVLHERIGHSLDYLLTTRLPAYAIFGAKVVISSAVGYVAAMLAIFIQLSAASLIGGSGWHWIFLAPTLGRVVAFGTTAALSLYVSVVGTFVALRVGEQRAAYMVSIFSVALLVVPFLVGWLHLSLTTQWVARATLVLALISMALGRLALRLFRRDKLVLYLQE